MNVQLKVFLITSAEGGFFENMVIAALVKFAVVFAPAVQSHERGHFAQV